MGQYKVLELVVALEDIYQINLFHDVIAFHTSIAPNFNLFVIMLVIWSGYVLIEKKSKQITQKCQFGIVRKLSEL